MMMRTGKALAAERRWREQRAERVVARAIPAQPLRDNVGYWLGVCVLIAFVAALILPH